MPASSISSSLSWALYIGAAFSLAMVLGSPLSVLSDGSRLGAATREADGIASVMDELKPGVTALIGDNLQASSGLIRLAPYSVTVSFGNQSISRYVPWQLPTMILASGTAYSFRLRGDSIEVVTVGGG